MLSRMETSWVVASLHADLATREDPVTEKITPAMRCQTPSRSRGMASELSPTSDRSNAPPAQIPRFTAATDTDDSRVTAETGVTDTAGDVKRSYDACELTRNGPIGPD